MEESEIYYSFILSRTPHETYYSYLFWNNYVVVRENHKNFDNFRFAWTLRVDNIN
jgi:hypothetical protein